MAGIDNLKKKYIGTSKVHFLIALYIASSCNWNRCCRLEYPAALESLSIICSQHFRLHCKIEWHCKLRLIIHSRQNERYNDVGINFKQQAAVKEKARANAVILGSNLDYAEERLEEPIRSILLRKDGLWTALINKC